MNNKIIVYVHGKDGTTEESDLYRSLFPSYDVCGIDYVGTTPWEAGAEIYEEIRSFGSIYNETILIANSIGAYFSMNAGIEELIENAFFISPIVDMKKLIKDMMDRAKVSEDELERKRTVRTELGEDLSWDYFSYVKNHPVTWNVPTDILYGSDDNLTDYDTISSFCKKHGARLTVMEGGEHWFHTKEQMIFLFDWIEKGMKK